MSNDFLIHLFNDDEQKKDRDVILINGYMLTKIVHPCDYLGGHYQAWLLGKNEVLVTTPLVHYRLREKASDFKKEAADRGYVCEPAHTAEVVYGNSLKRKVNNTVPPIKKMFYKFRFPEDISNEHYTMGCDNVKLVC